MKQTLNFILFLCVAHLFACGQKGPLFQANNPVDSSKNKTSTESPHKIIEAEIISIDTFVISGTQKQITENNATGWKSLFESLEDTNNLVRYLAFDISPVGTSSTPTFTMLVGTPQNKIINKQQRKTMKGGQYLRFKSKKRGIEQIPTLINQVNSYFNDNPRIKHGKAGDFIIENQHLVELYISVKKAQK